MELLFDMGLGFFENGWAVRFIIGEQKERTREGIPLMKGRSNENQVSDFMFMPHCVSRTGREEEERLSNA